MRHIILLAVTSLLLTPATSIAWGENNIGLYTSPTPDSYWWMEAHLPADGPGLYDIHLICLRPINAHTGGAIETIGGFELNIQLPEGWFFNGVTLPPNVLDFNSASHAFYCAGLIPVTRYGYDWVAQLATVTIGTFLEQPPAAGIHIEPYHAPSLPGQMAITDADDEFSISPAYPSSGDYAWPVLGINYIVVPTEGESWGNVKALFR